MIPSGLILKLVTLALAVSLLVPLRSVPAATGDDPYAAISRDIEREIAAGRADGVAVALTCKGKIIWERGFGWADKEKKKAVTPRLSDEIFYYHRPHDHGGCRQDVARCAG